MKTKIVLVLAVLALLLLSGCGDVAEALTEKERLKERTAYHEAVKAQALALAAQASAEETQNMWRGIAITLVASGTVGLAYYYPFLTVVTIAGAVVLGLRAMQWSMTAQGWPFNMGKKGEQGDG